MKSIQDLVYQIADKDTPDPIRDELITLTVDEMQRFHDATIAQYRESLLAGVGEPAVKSEPIWRADSSRSEARGDYYQDGCTPDYYTADQMAAAVLRERIKTLESVVELSTVGATYPELMKYLQAEIKAIRNTK